jgi:hypothetical protein
MKYLLLSLCILLSACYEDPNRIFVTSTETENYVRRVELSHAFDDPYSFLDVSIMTDLDNGCQYFILQDSYSIAIHARLDESGNPICAQE